MPWWFAMKNRQANMRVRRKVRVNKEYKQSRNTEFLRSRILLNNIFSLSVDSRSEIWYPHRGHIICTSARSYCTVHLAYFGIINFVLGFVGRSRVLSWSWRNVWKSLKILLVHQAPLPIPGILHDNGILTPSVGGLKYVQLWTASWFSNSCSSVHREWLLLCR